MVTPLGFLSASFARQGAAEASNPDMPIGTDKKAQEELALLS